VLKTPSKLLPAFSHTISFIEIKMNEQAKITKRTFFMIFYDHVQHLVFIASIFLLDSSVLFGGCGVF
jgi:hypothetical protein